MLRRIFLNSRKDRRKDGVILWDVEELTFLIIPKSYLNWLVSENRFEIMV